MKHVQIERAKWIRGEKDSMLYRPADGKSCCVGLVCAALGVPQHEMANIGSVEDLLDFNTKGVPAEFTEANTDYHECNCESCDGPVAEFSEKHQLTELYGINDAVDMDDHFREAKLVPLFAKLGIEVEFV